MTELSNIIQALLFSSSEAISIEVLAETTETSKEEITKALSELTTDLEQTGLRVSSHNDAYRLVTSPDATAILARYHQRSVKADLSRPALETLAIIAYEGPITRGKIETIRGVGSEQMIKNLLQRELIHEAGQANEPGRPTQYAVTEVFLDTVGITKLSDLPPLPEAIPTP
ncbi:MAG: SMC-Scp complex subunit ScpB [Candidatus Saccharibacteria bacterium]